MKFFLVVIFFLNISILLADDFILTKLTIKGNKHTKKSDITKQLNLKPDSFVKKMQFWRKDRTYYNINLFRQDQENILRLLKSQGFLYAQLDAKLIEKKGDKIQIIYTIQENKPVLISDVKFIVDNKLEINNPIKLKKNNFFLRQKGIELKPGKIFQDTHLFNDLDILKEKYQNDGYLKATTDYQITLHEDEKQEQATVDINYLIYPEQLYYIQGLRFSGNRNTDRATVRKQITLQDSMVYNMEVINETRDNLQRLGVFRGIQLYPSFIEGTDRVTPSFNFVENFKWTATFGVGYGTEERFRTKVDLTHHNIFKKADQQQLSVRYTEFEPYNLQFRWIQPAFIHRKLTLTLNPYTRRELDKDYNLNIFGNVTSFSYPIFRHWTVHLAHSWDQSNYERVSNSYSLAESIFDQSTIYTQLDINYANPKVNPVEGFHFITGVGRTGVFLKTSYLYYMLNQELRFYQPIQDWFLFAFRIAGQTLKEMDDNAEIAPADRLKLGGAQSIRGWKRNSIYPDNENKLGGKTSLLINAEARVPFTRNFSVALLYDTGQVMSESFDYNIKELYHSRGIGMRYYTPFGAIRVDLAQSFQSSFKDFEFYLTIGEAF